MGTTGVRWGREARWWFGLAWWAVRRHPGLICVAVAAVWLLGSPGLGAALVLVAALMAFRLWVLSCPAQAFRMVGPVRSWWWRRTLRRCWPEVAEACGLVVAGEIPRLLGTAGRWPHVWLRVRPLMGQTVETFRGAGEAVRMAVAVSRVRVEADGVRDVTLTFTVGDELRVPFVAAVPTATDDLSHVLLGRREDGQAWRLLLGPHTLVAGSSGAGKGSVFWSFAFGLAPAVRDERVQLHGIDLKGGMEILMGADLFTTRATSAAEAVVVLELLVEWMQARTAAYAGRVRSHEATTAEPLHVVMIDELAALTAYSAQRDLQRRAEAAINLLCSQGRAPGFVVFACLQDPRKEVIPSRGLFTQMVGLRLKDWSETSMVLGEAAMESGAACHRITRDVPGTGFVLPEDGSHPMRVRAGFASDAEIRRVASEYASPTQVPVVVPEPVEDPLERRRNRGVA